MRVLGIENVRAAANMYGVDHRDVAMIEDLGDGRYQVDSRGETWTFFDSGFGSLEMESRAPVGAGSAQPVALPADPGPQAENRLRALEQRIGGGSNAAGRRRALEMLAEMLERGEIALPEE